MAEQKIYASLHTHSMDRFDSQNNPDELCARFSELGAKGLVLTQHGVLSAVEPMRKACARYGLKFVPGIESYYTPEGASDEKRHLILIAQDDIGYHTLCKAVTDANDEEGMSVMNEDILRKYFAPGMEGHRHVIATSACIQGVVAMSLRKNDTLHRKIGKLVRHKEKFGISPDDQRVLNCKQQLEEIERLIKENKQKKNAAKKLADTKFGMRERQISKIC